MKKNELKFKVSGKLSKVKMQLLKMPLLLISIVVMTLGVTTVYAAVPTVANKTINVGAVTSSNIPITWAQATASGDAGAVSELVYEIYCASSQSELENYMNQGLFFVGTVTGQGSYTITKYAVVGTPTNLQPNTTYYIGVNVKNSSGKYADYTTTSGKTAEGSGIAEVQDDTSLQVYLNPTIGQLIINNEQLTIGEIRIFNTAGQMIMSLPSPKSHETTINISHLPNGIYYLKIDDNTVKLIKN